MAPFIPACTAQSLVGYVGVVAIASRSDDVASAARITWASDPPMVERCTITK